MFVGLLKQDCISWSTVSPRPIPNDVLLNLPDVIQHFKSSGRGWQAKIDETLKRALEEEKG